MNKKLIAAAVSAAVVAPVASQGAEVTVYGNLTNAIVSNDDGSKTDSKETNVSTVGSRLGFMATSDLGNGMSAVARYEFGTTTDTNKQDGFTGVPLNEDGTDLKRDTDGNVETARVDTGTSALTSVRHAYVGLSGGFGTFTIGQQSRAYHNAITGNVSPNYTAGVPVGTPGTSRTANTLKYANDLGIVNFELDVRVDDDARDAVDGQGSGFSVGVSFNPLENLNIGIGYDSTDEGEGKTQDEEESAFGFSAKYDFGPVWVSGGYQKTASHSADAVEATGKTPAKGTTDGIDTTVDTLTYQVYVGGSISDQTFWDVGYGFQTREVSGDRTDNETAGFALALSHNVGGGLVFFLEHKDEATDDGGVSEVVANSDATPPVKGVTAVPAVETDKSWTTLGMRLTF